MSILQLIQHPKTFLKSNAVWIGNPFAWMAKGKPDTKVWPVELVRTTNKSCTKSDGTVMPCWDLVPATSLNCTLAYYLPYVPNTTKEITISDKANLFLTDTLDGCTFAYSGNDTAKVAHLNYTVGQLEGAKIDQSAIDAEVGNLFPSGAATLKKADYETTDPTAVANVTVVGVRRPGGTWEFVYQRRKFKGVGHAAMEYSFISVHRVR